ncbi:hypothetical protein [Methylobacterium sp. Leaf456]|uniref:hypothetical protein n=1 Tax=Methylobacterium sp. Leaf456 TaxID=1736382 RepID=UPI0012E37134|nr:hypothetical protein [Methylobacterium sp. Leaf456]
MTRRCQPVLDDDRRFFEEQPNRQHRIRCASPAEVDVIADQLGRRPAQSGRWYAHVKQVEPGVRLRAFSFGSLDLDTDQPEDVCRAAYEGAVAGNPHRQRIEMRARLWARKNAPGEAQ